MPLLPQIFTPPRALHPFVLIQSSSAQSALPVVRALTRNACVNRTVLLFCLLYPPTVIADSDCLRSDNVRVFDWTTNIPRYADEYLDVREKIFDAIKSSSGKPFTVILDSVDTLTSDIGSLAETNRFLAELLSVVRAHNTSSRLVLHALSPSLLIPLLISTRFSAPLTHITAHPPALLTHLATAYLTPPPPLSPPEKFWGVFIPISERQHESERLVFGSGGEGSGSREIVVEVLVRGADGPGRRRGIERILEGWVTASATPCELSELESLKTLWTRKIVGEAPPDPTQNVSFNLNLTTEQQQSRSQVPLPYAHEGKPQPSPAMQQGAILYDPDSADDIDDDDPDEDLDI